MKHHKLRTLYIIVVLVSLVVAMILPFAGDIFEGKPRYENLRAFTDDLEKRLPDLMDEYGIPGVGIALIHDNDVIWEHYGGFADLDEYKPMSDQTVFQVGSISKPVTAWGIMGLVESGEIRLEDRITDLLDEWEFAPSAFDSDQITLAHLLTHTAGLPIGSIGRHMEYAPEEHRPDLRELLYQEAVVESAPGTRFNYSNPGYDLLELVIEDVTGTDFDVFMQNHVLMPSGMQNSSFQWSQRWNEQIASGYNPRGEAVPVYVYTAKPSGGLFATVPDIASFVAAGMPHSFMENEKLLTLETLNLMYQPWTDVQGIYGLVSDSYGLGYYLEELSADQRAVFHGGQGNGWMTHFHATPQSGEGIVILTNSQRSWPFIAEVLQNWRLWLGYSPIGMEMILLGQKGLQALINAIFLLSFTFLIRLIYLLLSGRRRLTLYSRTQAIRRSSQMGCAVIIWLLLIWSINQSYLFITSVFPVRSGWLAVSLLTVSVVLLLYACTVAADPDKKAEVPMV